MLNPMQLLNQFKQAQNPFSFMQQVTRSNPQMQKVIQNLQGKSPQELEQYARNMAKTSNINLSQFMNQFGISVQ